MRLQPRGASRGGCLAVILVLGLIWGGGQALYTGLTNFSPTEISVSDYLAKKPSAKWLTLKDCRLDLPNAAVRTVLFTKVIDELYIPVKAAGSETNGKTIEILFATKDPALMKTMERLREIKDEQAALAFLMEHPDEIYPTRTITGMIRFGIDLKESDRDKLASLDRNLSKDFIILDDGKSPELIVAIIVLAGGLFLGYLLLKNNPSKPTDPAAPGTLPTPAPPVAPSEPPATV